jgi:hypothetical protein
MRQESTENLGKYCKSVQIFTHTLILGIPTFVCQPKTRQLGIAARSNSVGPKDDELNTKSDPDFESFPVVHLPFAGAPRTRFGVRVVQQPARGFYTLRDER